ncbi:hypothetical protein Ancab_005775 [Ancistrocladus abbreviatus]
MFTPQRRPWSGWSLTPRTENQKSTGLNLNSNSNAKIVDGSLAKGKSVSFLETGSAYGNGGSLALRSDDVAVEGMDPEALAEKVSKLENELFEYQYNMGLLLIEKKEWTSKYEDLQHALAEVKDTLKREQEAHLIVISDAEKRVETLNKALGVEKQCVIDLHKELHEKRTEYAEIKFTADSKLAEANALAAIIEEKSLEVEAKLRAADAKHAEASRKSSEIDRRLQELEARESSLRRERLSFNSEREAHEDTLSKQREDLREWERKLQEGEERLSEARRILNQREERANGIDRSFKQKERDLEEAQKKIDAATTDFKKKEEDIKRRSDSLIRKEKEIDVMMKRIENKEKELLALEEKLNEREKAEIQKLLDKHKTELDDRKQQFEWEMNQKRENFDAELRNKVAEVEKKEVEISHKEEKIKRREEALEKKLEKLKEKEEDFELRSKDLKEKEKSIEAEEKNLEKEKNEMLIEKDKLLNFKAELEQRRDHNEAQLLKMQQERERLKVTEEERSELLRLQSELRREIEKCRLQEEVLLKDSNELKQERESFEQEWEALDEKKAEIEKELKTMTEEKERLEKWRNSEHERLKSENLTAQSNIQREFEALKLAKESFAADMEHEKSLLSERCHSERSKILNDLETCKRELEMEMQKKQEEMEKNLHERERLFKEEREKELNKINDLREVARRATEDMKEERRRIEKQKQEIAANKGVLEGHRLEIQKDIDELDALRRKLKDQRELFFKERERFVAFVEKNQSCEKCGEVIHAFVLSDLQSIHNSDRTEILALPELAAGYMRSSIKHALTPSGQQNKDMTQGIGDMGSPKSGGTSWLRKCTSLFKFSPSRRRDHSSMQNLTGESPVDQQANVEHESDGLDAAQDVEELSFRVASDAFDAQRVQLNDSVRALQGEPLAEGEGNIHGGKQDDVEASELSGLNGKQKVRRRGRPKKINWTRSMKAVVRDAKGILGDAGEENENEHPNGHAEDSEKSSFVDKGNGRNGKKRNRAYTSRTTTSEQDADETEGRSDSVMAGGRRKRHQKIEPALQVPAEKHYNLRRPKNVATAPAARAALSTFNKGKDKEHGPRGALEESSFSKGGATYSLGVGSENGGSINLVQGEAPGETNGGRGTQAKKQMENPVLSEEVNGTPEWHVEYGDRTPDRGEDVGEEGGDDDDDEEYPGEASTIKKIWTFFTT